MKKEQCVFAVGKTPDGLPCVLVGITPDCWEHLREGKTNSIDLARIGLPFRLLIYGGSTERDVITVIEGAVERGAKDLRDMDFTIPSRGDS